METFLISGIVTLVMTPLVLRLMRSRGIMDLPNNRSSHTTAVPRGGGLACITGTIVAALAALVQNQQVPWKLLLVVGLLSMIGLADDRQSLSARLRLATQVVAGGAMGYAVGGALWMGLGAIVVPVAVNVVNFMDGINGITSLSMAVWGLTAFAIGLTYAIPSLSIVGGFAAGTAMGFLPWNAPIARIFLGDSGSYLFGGFAAAGILLGWSSGAPIVLLIAPLLLYLADTGTVLIRRILRGDSLFQAHRDHIYQRLVGTLHLPHAIVSTIIGALSAVITASWLIRPLWVPIVVTVLVSATYLCLPLIVDSNRTRGAQQDHTIRK